MWSGFWNALTGNTRVAAPDTPSRRKPRIGRVDGTGSEMNMRSSKGHSEESRQRQRGRRASDLDLVSQLKASKKAEEDASRENQILRDELTRSKNDARQYQEERDNMRNDLDHSQRELHAAQEERESWRVRAGGAEREVIAKEELLKLHTDELARLNRYREERDGARNKLANYQQQLRTAQEERDSWWARADRVEREVATKDELLKLRTDELTHAQTFLSTTENVSHAEVLRMVENLNDLSSQLASELTECLTFARDRPSSSASSSTAVEEAIGSGVCHALVSASHANLPMMVHVAFSAAISSVATRLVESWGSLRNDNVGYLQRIYRHVLENEPQAISARWRILAHRSIQETGGEVDVISTISQDLLGIFGHIIRVAGGAYSEQYSAEQTKKMVYDVLAQCLEIKHVIMGEISSTNFGIFTPPPGAVFDSGCMEDVDGGGRSKGRSGNPILATTDVGLIRHDKVDGRVEKHVVLKAKAFLSLST